VNVHDLVPGLEDEIARQEGESPAERVAALEAELAELRDKWTRALAEAENVRRRAERDRRDAEAYGGTRLARDLLSVWDNLERAMKAADDTLRSQHGPFFEGVELTQRELLNAFGKHKIEKVPAAKGEKFDPNLHQAMFEVTVPGAEPGTIVETLQDGFVIAGRLLRPAMVGVASAASAAH
jgi:molecular chaperone GrpE